MAGATEEEKEWKVQNQARELTCQDFALQEPRYHVDTLLTKRLSLFVGDPKSAKSMSAINLAICTAGDRDFLGFSTRDGPVYYVNNEHGVEDSHDFWIEKFRLGLGLTDRSSLVSSSPFQYSDLTSKPAVQELLGICQQLGTVLLVVDNLGSSIGGQKETNNVAQALFFNLNRFCDVGIAVVVIHHFRKDDRVYRGPTSIPASVDRVFSFVPVSFRERQSKNENGELQWLDSDTPLMVKVLETFSFTCTTSRGEYPPSFLIGVEESDSTGAAKLVIRGLSYDSKLSEKIEIDLLSYLRASQRVDLREFCDWSANIYDIRDVRPVALKLIDEGKVEKNLVGKSFFLGLPDSSVAPSESTNSTLSRLIGVLLSKYKEEGRLYLSLKDDFVSPLTQQKPELSTEFGEGLAKRVASILRRQYEATTKREGDGYHVSL